jgi:hypothetical protein
MEKLPTKTKIAAKWLKIYSIVYLIFAVILYLITFPLAGTGGSPPRAEFLGLLLLILYPLFVLFFARSVLRGKKWAWWGNHCNIFNNNVNSPNKFYDRYFFDWSNRRRYCYLVFIWIGQLYFYNSAFYPPSPRPQKFLEGC